MRMLVTRRTKPCIHCGVASVVTVYEDDLLKWQGGALIQTVWPDWSPAKRELLITGTHPDCWEVITKEEET